MILLKVVAITVFVYVALHSSTQQFLMKVAILGNILGSLLARALKNYICSSINEGN